MMILPEGANGIRPSRLNRKRAHSIRPYNGGRNNDQGPGLIIFNLEMIPNEYNSPVVVYGNSFWHGLQLHVQAGKNRFQTRFCRHPLCFA